MDILDVTIIILFFFIFIVLFFTLFFWSNYHTCTTKESPWCPDIICPNSEPAVRRSENETCLGVPFPCPENGQS